MNSKKPVGGFLCHLKERKKKKKESPKQEGHSEGLPWGPCKKGRMVTDVRMHTHTLSHTHTRVCTHTHTHTHREIKGEGHRVDRPAQS